MDKVKLNELLEIEYGFAFKKEDYVDVSNYALVTLANISESNNFQFDADKTTYYGGSFPDDVILEQGDLIMPMTEQVVGLFGNSAFVPKVDNITFVLNQRVGKVVVNDKVADKNYIHYLLSTDLVRSQLENRSSGTRQRNISRDDIYDVTVFVPEIDSQKKIGELLISLENKNNLNSQIIKELEDTARLIFDYWFTQFDFPDENGKPYRSSGGKMVWNEELKREIPEGWKVVIVGELFDLQKGYSYSSEELIAKSDNPLISLASIDRNRNYRSEELKYLKNSVVTQRVANPGDLLIACTDLTRNADIIGSPVIVPDEFEKYVYSMDLAKVENLSSSVTKEFLYEALRTDWFHAFIKGFTSGTNVIHLDVKGFNWYRIVLPPIELQNHFSTVLDSFESKMNECRREIAELSTLRDWLLPMLMNGQVKVN